MISYEIIFKTLMLNKISLAYFRLQFVIEDKQAVTTKCFNCGEPPVAAVRNMALCFSATREVQLDGVQVSMCVST